MYEADVVVYRSIEGQPDFWIQRENGAHHEDLKRKAKLILEEVIFEGAPVHKPRETGELGEVLVPQQYHGLTNFEGIMLLNIGVEEGREEPDLYWTRDIVIKKRGWFDNTKKQPERAY